MSFVLAGYVDVEQIGRGGIGDVYRATRGSTGATVAIKVLRDVTDGSAAWRRARRELAALVSLAGHAHVVQVHEVLDLDGHPALVMEYVPCGSVGELLGRRGDVLEVGEAALVGVHAARALLAAHEQAIVHRDVKPQNLLIDAYGQVKLCDFGVAALARSGEFRDRTTALSMRYASPEDLEEAGDGIEVGPPSDVYSLGATLLHLAHGAPPTLRDRLAPWTPPVDADAELAALDAVIAGCLRTVPGERPTAAELLAELERLGHRLGAPGALVVDAAPGPFRPPADPIGSATVHRPIEPRRPAPARDGTRGTKVLCAVVGVMIVAAAVLATAFAVVGRGERAAEPASTVADPPPTAPVTLAARTAATTLLPSTTLSSFDRPSGLATLATVVWPFGQVGECLVQQPGADELRPVDCAAPHDLQRFASGEFGEDAPVAGSLDGVAGRACEERLRELVDPAALPAGVQIASTRPSPASWASGDRSYQCLLGVPDRRSIGDLLPVEAIDGGLDVAGRSGS